MTICWLFSVQRIRFPTNGLRWAYVTVATQMGEWARAHAGGFIHYSKAVQRDAERGLPSLSIIQLSQRKPPPFLAVFPFFLFVWFFLMSPVSEERPLTPNVQKLSISTPDIQRRKGLSERSVTVRQKDRQIDSEEEIIKKILYTDWSITGQCVPLSWHGTVVHSEDTDSLFQDFI